MSLQNKSQKLAARILETHIRHGRLPSAYIFSGQENAEGYSEMMSEGDAVDIKETFAIALACALQSGAKKLFADPEGLISKRIREQAHPDVRWAGADPAEKSIKIETIRDIIHWAFMKPYEGLWKVCIIKGAERLTEEGANAFLKTLEEPPPQTVFLLLVENRTHLLETIQSRAFEIRLMPHFSDEGEFFPGRIEKFPVREIFDVYPTLAREEVKQKVETLMRTVRNNIYQVSQGGEPREAETWLKVMDLLYDALLALDANANQKLVATRLAMQLKNLFPGEKVLA